MSNALAKTSFFAGPKTSMAAVDVYGTNGQSVINNVQPINTNPLNVKLNLGGVNLNNLLVTKPPAINNTMLGDPTDRMMCSITDSDPSFTSSLKSSFKQLDPRTVSSIVNGFQGGRGLQASIGGQNFNLKGSQYGSSNPLGQFMNVLTNNPSFYQTKDRDGKSSLLSGIIREGTRMGIPNLLTTLGQNNLDKRTKQRVLTNALPGILQSGKTLLFKDAANSDSRRSIPSSYPSYTRDFGKWYTPPLNGYEDPDKEYESFTFSNDSIQPGWDRRTYGNTSALNLSQLSGGNKNFTSMISTGASRLDINDPRKMMGMCSIYSDVKVSDSLKSMYPKTVLMSPNQQQITPKGGVVDPRTLNVPAFDYAGPDNAENPDGFFG